MYKACMLQPTARDFFLANFYSPGPLNCIFSKLSLDFFMLAVSNTGSYVGSHNKTGHPARRYTQLIQVPVLGFNRIGSKTRVVVFLGWQFEIVSVILILRES